MIKIKKEKLLVSPKDFTPSSKELEIIGTINPAAIRLPNNDILLYARVIEKLITDEDEEYYYSPRMAGESEFKLVLDKFKKETVEAKNPLDIVFKDGTKRLNFISHLRTIILDKSGFKIKKLKQKPAFYGLAWDGELGIEDPRIARINNLYVMTYVALTRDANVSTNLAISNDGIEWYRRGIIFEEQNKDVVIFPELINNKYVSFNRPEGSFEFSSPHIWISYSKDLEHWGGSSPIILSKKGEWDYDKVGAGPIPLKTQKGWLFIYHGVKEYEKKAHSLIEKINEFLGKKEERISYNVGAALLDLKNPKKIIAKSISPILKPTKKYEKGTIENKDVVFPTALIPDLNNNDVLMFSGGGDIVTSVKKISLSEILKSLRKV